ncbi:hypothetical protein ZIOFF_051872 [Zingiber officinale]|uniref:SHSP domain-containing protein n=1 Tax=Zingiber officinale TaxID=94328 RepID=A0A8J5FMM3_ZINOF|nr:hypothetical protein ZIOFF_051872 [Zingiber officinale]
MIADRHRDFSLEQYAHYQQEKDDKWHRMECSSGKFLHQFRRPENVEVDPVKARMENGVLTVTISKEEANCNRS